MIKLFILFLIAVPQIIFSQNLFINEVMSSNTKSVIDEFGDTSDWIEIFNNSSNNIDLNSYYLSDDSADIMKWQFANISIEANSYLIIFASDRDTLDIYPHTNFKINASGEKIIFSDPSGNIIDSVYIPASLPDISYGRISDGGSNWEFQQPTPGEQNSGNLVIDYSDPVIASTKGGFYSSSISVELSANGNDIYYTLDGSDPDLTSIKYNGAISIDKTTVLKALSMKQNYLPSKITFESYFINENTDLPVISLIADPFDLFDPDSGIYVNYTMDWERPAYVEFFEDDKSLGFSENCGIEIYGSQSANWDQKSISVKFKNKYGISELDYPLFPDFWLDKFKAFVLRNAGNDWQFTHIRDAVMQTLVKDLDIDYLEYRPATSFINGEYWGIYNIREKINEHYIANRHGVDPDNIDLLENNMNVIVGDSLSYQALIDFVSTTDMTTDAAYAYIDSVIDLDECILYFAAQAYYDNLDWPGTNIKYWRERSPNGKWRWILFGVEFGFGLYAHGPEEDHISFMFSPVETRYSNPPWATLLQRKLIENPTIRNMFINQNADLLNTNFRSGRVVEIINKLADHISSDIGRHRARWNLNGENLNKMIDFANRRPTFMRTHIRDYFNCGADGQITLNSSDGGRVKLNTIYINKSEMPWKGIYFSGVPIELKAIPDEGYKFDGWSGDITTTDPIISVSVERSTNITAMFSPGISSANKVVLNEINYNSSEFFNTGDWIEIYNSSEDTLNLSDWYLSDSNDDNKYYFPSGTNLNPDDYLVLVENDSAFSSLFPEVDNRIGEIGFGLNGSGELIRLFNEESQLIDSVRYDDSLNWPREADGLGATLELINSELDNSLPENWQASLGNGTPGKKNSVIVGIERTNSQIIPKSFELFQNYPNPFNPVTRIQYSVPYKSHIRITVFDIIGKEIETLVDDVKDSGKYSIDFDGNALSSGVYFYKMEYGGSLLVKKLLLIK